MHQILIASKPIINKGKKNIDSLIKHLLLLPKKLLQSQIGKPKPLSQTYKNLIKKYFTVKTNKKALANNIAIKEDIKKSVTQVII